MTKTSHLLTIVNNKSIFAKNKAKKFALFFSILLIFAALPISYLLIKKPFNKFSEKKLFRLALYDVSKFPCNIAQASRNTYDMG